MTKVNKEQSKNSVILSWAIFLLYEGKTGTPQCLTNRNDKEMTSFIPARRFN